METTYPAAHSMDTTWFAIDGAGHVGLFWTGEEGTLPKGAAHNQQNEGLTELDLLAQWYTAWGMPTTPDEIDEAGVYRGDFLYDLTDVGFYLYEYREDLSVQGLLLGDALSVAPQKPLHLDQLFPQQRAMFAQLCLDVDFEQTTFVQPLESHECSAWANRWNVAYLGQDEKTIRALTDDVAKFQQFVSRFRRERGELAEELDFEKPSR